jgi:hypothetical protein
MSDLFSRVCMILALGLLGVIAFRSTVRPPQIAYTGITGPLPAPRSGPAYQVIEAEPDAGKIGEILTKHSNEGAWELAAPVYTSGPNGKVILILVRRW